MPSNARARNTKDNKAQLATEVEKTLSDDQAKAVVEALNGLPVNAINEKSTPNSSGAAGASAANSSAVSGDATPASADSNEKKPRRSPILLYRQLLGLQQTLAYANPKLAKTQDRFLASVGYPAKLLGYLTGVKQLSSLSALISDYRTFSRVVATPATLQWTLDLLLSNRNPDKLDRWGDYIQAVAGSLYQILEDLAYLGGKGVIPMTGATETRLWIVSCMFWAVHVLIELLRVPYYYQKYGKFDLRTVVVNLAWAPLTVHWSTETGIFSEGWVGVLGTLACWPNMVYQWRNA